ALAAALTTGGTLQGVVFMLGFGIGTAPVMFLIALLGKQIQGGLRKRLTALMPVFAAAIAILIILRGMNLGVPYISPKVMGEQAQEQKGGACH
ncbi:MAG: sulfite exporter TauE/SafE family protein, partial [Bacteroidetes bacterium]|nr:sulfite exporter TauE/SafE family protein [Bacteroidota bacterium]